MIDAHLKCRECNAPPIVFASEFEPNDATKVADTQQHMKNNFLARCGVCFACNWEVIKVSEVDYGRN